MNHYILYKVINSFDAATSSGLFFFFNNFCKWASVFNHSFWKKLPKLLDITRQILALTWTTYFQLGLGQDWTILKFENSVVEPILWICCFWSLSCWKIQPRHKLSFRTECKKLSFKIAWYFSGTILPSLSTILAWQIMLPTTCLTADAKFFSSKAVLGNRYTYRLSLFPQNSSLVSSDHKTFCQNVSSILISILAYLSRALCFRK